jgi:hypothetical protein
MTEGVGLFSDPATADSHKIPAAEPAEAPRLVYGSAEGWYFHAEAVSRVEPCGGRGSTCASTEQPVSVLGGGTHADHHMRSS